METQTKARLGPNNPLMRASTLERDGDARPTRAGSRLASAAAILPDAEEAAVPRAARGPVVSDALLESHVVEARDRRAAWANTGVPFVSLAILAALLCAAWLT
jgi:hypothetical protein